MVLKPIALRYLDSSGLNGLLELQICDFEIEFVVEGNSLLCYDLITIEDPLNRDEISYQFCGPRVSDSFLRSESNQLDVIFTSDFRNDF